jgi:hypothetical protein
MPAFAALTPPEPPGLWDTGKTAPALPLPEENDPARDAKIRMRIGRLDAEPQPRSFSNTVHVIRKGQPCDPRLPGTPHRQGMQVTMADGSVRVFGPETEQWVFWSACGSR